MKSISSILVVSLLSVPSSFALQVHLLPNVSRSPWIFNDGSIASPEESEAKAKKEEAILRAEKGHFNEDEKTKADLALIEKSIDLLKSFHLDQIEAILGPRQEISENYILPAVFWRSALGVPAQQEAGEYETAFFPIGELGGIYVIQYERLETISAGAIYLKRCHSHKVIDPAVEPREAAREIERPELEAIKATVEKIVAENYAE